LVELDRILKHSQQIAACGCGPEKDSVARVRAAKALPAALAGA
jgi:hypothetical protein